MSQALVTIVLCLPLCLVRGGDEYKIETKTVEYEDSVDGTKLTGYMAWPVTEGAKCSFSDETEVDGRKTTFDLEVAVVGDKMQFAVEFDMDPSEDDYWTAVGWGNGQWMSDLDVIIIEKKSSGGIHLKDSHVRGFRPPKQDRHQNVNLDSMEFSEGKVFVKFSRLLISDDNSKEDKNWEDGECHEIVMVTSGGPISGGRRGKRQPGGGGGIMKHWRPPKRTQKICANMTTEGLWLDCAEMPKGGGQKPGVLVVHDANGKDSFEDKKAENLAKMGYIAFALDVFGSPEDPRGAMKAIRSDRDLWHRRLNLGLDQLKMAEGINPEKIGAIGYCFGGTSVLDMARANAPLAGVVSFHGGLNFLPENSTETMNVKVMVLTGYADPSIPQEKVIEFEKYLEDREADWQVHVFGNNTKHAWTIYDRPDRYHPVSDARSWELMEDFFDEVLDEKKQSSYT